MDVLRKELQEVFSRQRVAGDRLSLADELACRTMIDSLSAISRGAAILSNLASNTSYFAIGDVANLLSLHADLPTSQPIDIDEDFIYRRLHPEDLVDKRMLELRYFLFAERLKPEERLHHHACCRIRMQNADGEYLYFLNLTRIQRNSPSGRMQMVVCLYDLAPNQEPARGIDPCFVDSATGHVEHLALYDERFKILSQRETEVLLLIRQGLLSKEIAHRLHISLHTVNTHRQHILQKLSVGNSMEAVKTAEAMRLI